MNRTQLPEVFEADLDDESFKALAAELSEVALVALLRESPRPVPLQRALDDLREGRTRGVRVRYRHQGDAWMDTLMPGESGVCRLVRIREAVE